jgi:hypothetical protein
MEVSLGILAGENSTETVDALAVAGMLFWEQPLHITTALLESVELHENATH